MPSVARGYRSGVQALQNTHRRLVRCADARRLTGSINLDDALRATMPNDPRWDYGIGYREGNRERALWIEVHGAYTSKVGEVIKKLRWLKDWLAGDGESLNRLTGPSSEPPSYVWLASGRISLPPHTRQFKEAAKWGILPRKTLDLP